MYYRWFSQRSTFLSSRSVCLFLVRSSVYPGLSESESVYGLWLCLWCLRSVFWVIKWLWSIVWWCWIGIWCWLKTRVQDFTSTGPDYPGQTALNYIHRMAALDWTDGQTDETNNVKTEENRRKKLTKTGTKTFWRHQSDRFKCVPSSWRKPKGIDNRVRRRFKSNIPMPSVCFPVS